MNKRRRYFIDRRTQLPILLLVLSPLPVFYLAFFFVVSIARRNLIAIFEQLHLASNMDLVTQVETALDMGNRHLFFVFLATFIVTVFIGILVSHRIGGPLFHIKRAFNQAEHLEDLPEIRLRKADILQDLAAAINGFRERALKK